MDSFFEYGLNHYKFLQANRDELITNSGLPLKFEKIKAI